jgi:hypothetical protein
MPTNVSRRGVWLRPSSAHGETTPTEALTIRLDKTQIANTTIRLHKLGFKNQIEEFMRFFDNGLLIISDN